jgi:hypothetical protein
MISNEITITSTKWLYRLVREFRSTICHIATGFAGGGLFNGNANREVMTVPFLNNEKRTTNNRVTGERDMLAGTFNVPRRINGEV